ncbi:GTPase family protein [Oceanisphaera sp. W20_SRM_FM3]|uniref:GTPase family protein n=1 Tax=Oceanisphaera sp. W20_SRM_FM3 TaxID=3240267 RepID=UPI003F99031B
MIKLKNIYQMLARLSGDRWTAVVLVSILPMLILMGFGIVLAIKYGYLLALSLAITLSVTVVYVIISVARVLAEKTKKQRVQQLNRLDDSVDDSVHGLADDLVSASAAWSKRELEIWQQAKAYSRALLVSDSDWSEMDKKVLLVFDLVAKAYNKQSLDFSISEGLKLIEEISRRYRLVLKEHIPVVEFLNVSRLKSGYELYDKYGDFGPVLFNVLKALNYAKDIVINPAKAVSDFIKQQFSANMTQGIVDEMQLKAKAALLDEVAAVAINLYSKRFSIEDEDVKASQTMATDSAHLALELEPIRMAIIGQIGAGKSSLTNLLKGEFAVEVGALATTSGMTVCEALLGDVAVKIVDLPGLDGNEASEALMLAEYVTSDLVLWLVRANQPARELDNKFKQKINQHYAKTANISRKEPTVICIVNQVDRLAPANDWQPPYDVTDMSNQKSKTISQAMAYNKGILTPDFTVALSISDTKPHFGVEDLKLLLSEQLLNAYNVQLNRRNKEAVDRGVGLAKQVRRVGKSGKAMALGLFKYVKTKYSNPPQ